MKPIDRPDQLEPIPGTPGAANFATAGWSAYAQHDHEIAVKQFRQAIEADGEFIDAYYGLGLALKAAGKSPDAIEAFQAAIDLSGLLPEKDRAHMIARLAQGQINQIQTGDWHLEGKIYGKSSPHPSRTN